jgi:hypothetical protein
MDHGQSKNCWSPRPTVPARRDQDMSGWLTLLVVVAVLALIGLALSVRVVQQYEKGVLFRLGRVIGVREPGLRLIVPLIEVLRRVSLRIVTMPIQSQGIITRDNVSIDVSAVAYYRVTDAVKSVVAIENVAAAINQIAQTTLRKVVGQHTLDETLAETDRINLAIREILDRTTEDWGVVVTLVELKDIQLPETYETGHGPPGRGRTREAGQDHRRRRRIPGRRPARGGLGCDDGPSVGLAAAQPPEPGRARGRQEHHGGVPGPADEHHPGAGRLPGQGAGRRHHPSANSHPSQSGHRHGQLPITGRRATGNRRGGQHRPQRSARRPSSLRADQAACRLGGTSGEEGAESPRTTRWVRRQFSPPVLNN